MTDETNLTQQDIRDELPESLANSARAGDVAANEHHKEMYGEPLPEFADDIETRTWDTEDYPRDDAGRFTEQVEVPEPPTVDDEQVVNLWKELINRHVLAQRDVTVEAKLWNPANHPRRPDGQFVDRPHEVPADVRELATDVIVTHLAIKDGDFQDHLDERGMQIGTDERGTWQVEAEASFSEGDVVTYDDEGHIGVVLDIVTSEFEWPGSDGTATIEATDDRPAIIVARETGGSAVFWPDELTEGSFPDDAVVDEDELKDVEAAAWYDDLDDPFDAEEVRATLEAANIPGVDDREIGFQPGEPEGWDRLSYLSAYVSLGASFSSCVADMTGRISKPKRWCGALKDEVYGTEEWRGGWG